MRDRLIFIIIFITSFISIEAQVDHWETAVYADADWKYFLGYSEPPADWNSNTFNDVTWNTGQGGIGYGDGDDNTIIPSLPSVYMRRAFYVTDETKIDKMILHADYDDGFVAYLNGVEIARSNVDGNPPAYNTSAIEFKEAIMYSGGLPETFVLDDNIIQSLLTNGINIFSVQTHNFGTNSSDMTSLYWLSLGINDNSNDYGPTPSWFVDENFNSPLPIVTIDTDGEYIPDEPSIQGEMGIIWNGEGMMNSPSDIPNEFLGNISIDRRGQSSLDLFPKNGYAIETKDAAWEDMDVSFLNFPAEEDWILHGPYSDKSLLRNVLAMHLANEIGQYASRTRMVELIINDSYEGIYVLMEKIKRDESRVDIAKLKEEDISGDELTGGYIIKIDKEVDIDWYSQFDIENNPGQKLGFQYVSPKASQIQPAQATYIQSFMDSVDRSMLNPSIPYGGKYYWEYMDIASFADHFILEEISKDVDAYRLSSYMFKDKDSNGGLLQAGPVWDFNLAYGNSDGCNANTPGGWMLYQNCGYGNPFWWNNLIQEDLFVNILKCRYEEFREDALHTDSIMQFIDEKAALMGSAINRNFQRWPILGEYIWSNPIIFNTYQEEIDYLKYIVSQRLEWMDNNMLGNCIDTNVDDMVNEKSIRIFPNPNNGNFQIQISENIQFDDFNIQITDVTGKEVLTKNIQNESDIQITGLDLPDGIYFLQLESKGKILGVEKIVVQ